MNGLNRINYWNNMKERIKEIFLILMIIIKINNNLRFFEPSKNSNHANIYK